MRKNVNQVIVHQLFPDDEFPTLFTYSDELTPNDKWQIRYPKYTAWQRIVIMPSEEFEKHAQSMQDKVFEVEKTILNNTEKMLRDSEELLHPNNILSDDLDEIINS